MKVLLLNHFPLEGSGSGTYTKNIALQLAELGHEVSIIMPENRRVESASPLVHLHPVYFRCELPLDGCLPFNFPCFTTHPRSNTSFGMLSLDDISLYMKAFATALDEEIARFRPDIIHSQHVWMLSYLAARKGVPCVVTSHGTAIIGYEKWPVLHRFAEGAVDRCDEMIALSRDYHDLILKHFPQAEKKLHLIPHGYSAETFYPVSWHPSLVLSSVGIHYREEKIVLYAGKLAQFKGVETLLEAAKEYAAGGDVLTIIAGGGDWEEALRNRASRLGLRKVYFVGNQPQDKLRHLYNVADVLAVPSEREAFGVVALEAMACGTPVVASNVGNLADFIRPEVGTLVDPGKPMLLSAAIQVELAKGQAFPERRESIAAYAKKNHSQAHMIEALLDVYRLAISKHDTGGQSA